MRITGTILSGITLFLASYVEAQAQDLGGTLRTVGQPYAKAYVRPLVDAFGADINAGLFHAAKFDQGALPGVDLYIGVKVFGAFVPTDQRTLDLSYEAPLRTQGEDGNWYDVRVRYEVDGAPTIFGETEAGSVTAHISEVVAPGADGVYGTPDDVLVDQEVTLDLIPGLINTGFAPFAVPQLRVGTLYGTDLMIRVLPRLSHEVGSLGYFGLGVRHDLTQYLASAPVDVSVQLAGQKLSIRDGDDERVVGASMLAWALIASKSASIATFYGGLQLESTRVEIDYLYAHAEEQIDPQRIRFGMSGRNRVRGVAGAALALGPLVLNVDYSLGSVNVVSAGIGLTL